MGMWGLKVEEEGRGFSFVAKVDSRFRIRVPRNEAVYYGLRPGLYEIQIIQRATFLNFIGRITKDFRLTIPKKYRESMDPKQPLEVTIETNT